MPILIMIIGAISAAAFWYYRMQAAQRGAADLLDAANDVRLAARRFGFKRKLNVHPADSIEDPRLAAAGIVSAFAGMSGPVERSQTDIMIIQFQSVFGASKEEAAEFATFGRWIAEQCGTRSEAVRRLSKKLANLAGAEALPDLERIIDATLKAEQREDGEEEKEAMDQLRRRFAA